MALPAADSHGWAPPDRAPGLRRAADLIEQRAGQCAVPQRALRLARDLRLRATEIELANYAPDDETLAAEMLAMGIPQ